MCPQSVNHKWVVFCLFYTNMFMETHTWYSAQLGRIRTQVSEGNFFALKLNFSKIYFRNLNSYSLRCWEFFPATQVMKRKGYLAFLSFTSSIDPNKRRCEWDSNLAPMHLSVTPSNNLGRDKVSMLTHTYPHKPLRKIKVTICNHQSGGPLCVVALCLIWWFASLEKYGHTWHRMSLPRPGVIKQHKQTTPSNNDVPSNVLNKSLQDFLTLLTFKVLYFWKIY